MAEKPILMCTDMVRAAMREVNPKTQTRRVIKPQPKYNDSALRFEYGALRHIWKSGSCWNDEVIAKPKYAVGDVLWVRETWRLTDFEYIDGAVSASVMFKDGTIGARLFNLKHGMNERCGWRPSIHMPRAAARLFLRITGVRAERLQDITEEDALAEGVIGDECTDNSNAAAFAILWDCINEKRDGGAYTWDKNPYVWVYKFERVDR